MNMRGLKWTGTAPLAALVVLAMASLASSGCDTYYIPPPPVSIFINNFTPGLVITATDSAGNLVPATLQLQAAVSNSPNTNIIYSVGVDGNYVQGGNNVFGFISSTGLYTAPPAVPTPNTVTVLAVAAADTSQRATTTITLFNQPANPTSLAPGVVTAGKSYTFDIVGNFFAQGATVNLSGAQVNGVQQLGSQEMKVTAQITAPGLLSLNIVNPDSNGDTNAVYIRSEPASPAASGSVAVLVAHAGTDTSGNPVTATKAYVPESDHLAVVNLEANKQIGSVVMPNGYIATMAAAHPSKNQVVVASYASNLVQIVDANSDQVLESLPVPVSTQTTVNGATCTVCGLIVDSARDRAVLDTAAGYLTLNLDDGSTTAPLAAPAAANFSYDPNTQRIYAPFNGTGGAGVTMLDLIAGTVSAVHATGSAALGASPDTAAFDPATALLHVGDANANNYVSLNFNTASASGGAIPTPAASYTITTGCVGAWNGVNLEFTSHVGWFANLGSCVGVANLPASPGTGSPTPPSQIRWAQVPVGPDGLPWANTPTGHPHSLAVYLGADGKSYGLAVRQDSSELLKMDLALLQTANAVTGGVDVNQVDPTNVTVNGVAVSAMTYIPLR